MNIKKKLAAFAVIGAVVAGGLSVAQTASAAEIPGATLTITPTSGNVNTDVDFLNSISASVAAPVGFRALGGTFAYQGGVEMGPVAQSRTTAMVSTNGTNGLDGNLPIFMDRSINPTNVFISNRLLNATNIPLATGPFELRWYYFASSTAPNRVTDPYIKLDMQYNATTGAWSLFTAATATTTSLTASASGTSVALTATVAPVAAAGTVTFLEGATPVATGIPVVAGVATTTLTGVTSGPHTYTAQFVPTDAAAFAASTSASASVNVGSIPAPIAAGVVTGNITVQVGANAGGGVLVLTASNLTRNLGPALPVGGFLTASGSVTAVVDDSRSSSSAPFTLTGQVGNFTDGAKVLSSRYLGWTPSATGAAAAGVGAIVVGGPAATDGLLTTRNWVSGIAPSAADPQVTTTNASALLQLRAPLNTASGNYSATMTLTLV